MKLIKTTPVLLTLEINEVIEFYQEKMGFKCSYKTNEGFAILQRDDIELHFTVCRDKALIEWSSCRVEVLGIDVLYQEYLGHNIIHPHGSLKDSNYGTREFSILDPFGVCITFFERTLL